jgi:glutathione S-transferase
MAESNEVIVGSWPMRGTVGTIRCLLAYCGIPFQNKQYTNRKEWFGKDKEQLGFDYPNLPYLIDGNTKLAESVAILHYIPLKAGRRELLGETDDKFIQVEQAFGVVMDTRSEMKCQRFFSQKTILKLLKKNLSQKEDSRTS